MLEFFTEPLQESFIHKALVGIILASINCATIGCYVVLRRIAFLGEALTHTLLPGVVFSYLRGMNLYVGALIASLATVLGIGFLTSKNEVRQDSAIGVVLSFMFALGILMMSHTKSFRDFGTILYGNVLGVTMGHLILVGSITFIVLNALYWLHKEMELAALDPVYAQLIHVKPKMLYYLLLFLIAASVVSAVQMIGALLTTALLIVPPASAAIVARTVVQMMLIAVAIAITGGVVGLYASFYFEISAGAAVVITCSVLFFIIFLFKRGFVKFRESIYSRG